MIELSQAAIQLVPQLEHVFENREFLLGCIRTIKRSKERLSFSLFKMILRDNCTNGDPGNAVLWSKPRTAMQVMAFHNNRFSNPDEQKRYEKPFLDRVQWLRENHIFNVFCANGYMSFAIEPNVFSWGVLCRGKSYLYPRSVRNLIASRHELGLLYTSSGLVTDRLFDIEFDIFVRKLVLEMYPLIRGTIGQAYSRYKVEDIVAVLEKSPDYYFIDHASFDIKRMPVEVRALLYPESERKFANIMPISPDLSGKRVNTMPNNLDAITDPELRIDYEHTAFMLEFGNLIKKRRGDTSSDELIGHDRTNIAIVKSIFDDLRGTGFLNEGFISGWMTWFIDNSGLGESKLVADVPNLLRTFRKSLWSFARHSSVTSFEHYGEDISAEMAKFFDFGVGGLRRSAIEYGIILSGTYAIKKSSSADPESEVRAFVSRLLDIEKSNDRYNEVVLIAWKTMLFGNDRGGLFSDQVKKMIISLVTGIEFSDEEDRVYTRAKSLISNAVDEFWLHILEAG